MAGKRTILQFVHFPRLRFSHSIFGAPSSECYVCLLFDFVDAFLLFGLSLVHDSVFFFQNTKLPFPKRPLTQLIFFCFTSHPTASAYGECLEPRVQLLSVAFLRFCCLADVVLASSKRPLFEGKTRGKFRPSSKWYFAVWVFEGFSSDPA